MKTDRRSMLLGMPGVLLGLSECGELTWAQSAPSPDIAAGVADFWAKRMGVPPKLLLQGAVSARPSNGIPGGAGRQIESLSNSNGLGQNHGTGISTLGSQPVIEASATSAGVAGFAREPMFFHLDEDQHALIPAAQVPTQKLHPSGDTIVELQLHRLRLSPADTQQFGRFASGGIYLDMQQPQAAQHPAGQTAAAAQPTPSMPLASSILSAFFLPAAARKPAAKTAKSPAPSASSAGNIPLQQTAESQSIALQNGIGKLGFSCFMKDRRKSAFGTFVSAFLEMGSNSNNLSYLTMLSLPVVAAPALVAVRALVANLQTQGLDHQWILGCGGIDVASTATGCSSVPEALRLRTGTYIAIPREHSDSVRNKLAGLKLADGFLVPKDASDLDLYDAVPQTLAGATYLSLSVKVKPTKLTGCVVPVPA
jgi:hypothetical protein